MKLFGVIILFLAHYSCTSQNKKNMDLPAVTKQFEKIDIGSLGNLEERTPRVIGDGLVVVYQKESDGVIAKIFSSSSNFILIKKFYENGNIQEKGLVFNSGFFKKGFWYYYNKEGELLRQENHDEGYKYTFEDLYKFLTRLKIPLTKGRITQDFHTKIFREIEGGRRVWYVHWLIKADKIEIITIDGKSGQILHKEYMEYSNS